MSGSGTDPPALAAFDDAAALDPALVGRKAANLARLAAAGLPVPLGVVVTAEACGRILDACGLGPDPTPEQVAACPVPGDLRDQLERALAPFGEAPLAVRSSGLAEDLAGASYAGQYETVLGVRGADAVADALRICLASAFSGRVTAYRATTREASAAPMAVLVQRLIDADAAGVAFTANPSTGDRDEVHVSAVRGLGERLVSGEASADECVVRGESVECRAGPEQALDADLARRVADLARRVEALFGVPQDIEWALAGGELNLLQARPMTAFPRPPEIEVPAEGFWEKDDWHYPTPMTAFGASVYLPALEHGLATQCREFGILAEGEQQRWIGHEVYGRTVPYRGKRWPRWPWWLFGLVARISPELRRRARIADQALRSGLAERYLATWESEWREAFRREAAALRSRDLGTLDDVALLDHLDEVIDLHRRGSVAHFRLNTPYGLAVRELYAAARELLGWDPPQALTLLAGASGISSEPGRRLTEVAELLARSPAVREVLEQGAHPLVERLRSVAPEAADVLAAYIDAYGHRPIGYDPGDPTLAERSELLAGQLRDRVRASDPAAGEDPAVLLRDEALGRARAILADRPAPDRERFERALAWAWRAYPAREESIFYGDSLPSALLRYAALEFGRRLVERRLLDRADDAVHLTADELRGALRDGRGAVRELVARRRAERVWVMAHPGPATYGREEGRPPDLRAAPPALRLFNRPWLVPVAGLGSPSAAPARDELVGAPGSPGSYSGAVRVIRDDSEFDRLRPGEVLVCPTASPAWSVLFAQAGALVTDVGGASSHPAIIAREYGIPAVLGTGDATRRLRDGQLVTVDGTAGRVRIEAR